LANQAWKIIQRPNCLLYRLLKARYFKDGNFFSASRGTKPSYGWNSLRFGRELLENRVQRSIGDGRTTNLGDPWLPTTPPRAPKLLDSIDPNTKVAELLLGPPQQWDEQKLHQYIDSSDHHLIHKLFIPYDFKDDAYIWTYMKDGNFTVKSGYWRALNLSIDDDAPQAPLAVNTDIAQKIWRLQIVPKLKHFLWRFASKAIGISENQRRRNINVNPYCTRCCNEVETNDHAMFTCPQVKQIWRASGLPTQVLWDPNNTMEDKVRHILGMYEDTKVEISRRCLPFWLMWRIWKSRNDLVFNKRATDMADIIKQTILDTKEWLDNTRLPERPYREQQSSTLRKAIWQRPPVGWVKCNYDVSHHEGNKFSGLGWIIRNSQGICLDCGMGKFQGRQTIEEAECTALIWAIQCVWGLGYRKVIFEGDNLSITSIINNKTPNPRLRHYLDFIHQWSEAFTTIKFKFCHRENNVCADILARKAIVCNTNFELYRSCPGFLGYYVNNDVKHFH